MGRHVIALDVGGTCMKAALVAPEGGLLHQERRPTYREQGPEAVLSGVLGFAADLRAYGTRTYGEAATAAGVAVPGVVDERAGVAAYAANIGWRDVPLRALLAEHLGGTPVALGHDVRVGGLAEGRAGAAKGAERFLFVALGTGVAGAFGMTCGSRSHVDAAELGHIVVRPDGAPCGCGQRGCLETVASATAVARAWRGDAADCARAVVAGDRRADDVWNNAVAALADGLLASITLFHPDVLVVGGGLAEAGDTLFEPLRRAVKERVTFQRLPSILPASLGDTAGCLGAGLLAWDLIDLDNTTVEVTA
jgi:glucokinase